MQSKKAALKGLAVIPVLPYLDEPLEHVIDFGFEKAWPVEKTEEVMPTMLGCCSDAPHWEVEEETGQRSFMSDVAVVPIKPAMKRPAKCVSMLPPCRKVGHKV